VVLVLVEESAATIDLSLEKGSMYDECVSTIKSNGSSRNSSAYHRGQLWNRRDVDLSSNTSLLRIVIVKLDFDERDLSNAVEWLPRIFSQIKSPLQEIIIRMVLPFGMDSDKSVDSWKEYDMLLGDSTSYNSLPSLFITESTREKDISRKYLRMKLPTCDLRGILKVVPLSAREGF
jgi:hypothetical protein